MAHLAKVKNVMKLILFSNFCLLISPSLMLLKQKLYSRTYVCQFPPRLTPWWESTRLEATFMKWLRRNHVVWSCEAVKNYKLEHWLAWNTIAIKKLYLPIWRVFHEPRQKINEKVNIVDSQVHKNQKKKKKNRPLIFFSFSFQPAFEWDFAFFDQRMLPTPASDFLRLNILIKNAHFEINGES